MNYYRFPEKKPLRILFACLLAVLLLLTRDAMYSMMVWDFYACQTYSFIIMGLMVAAFVWVNRRNLKQILLDQRMLMLIAATLIVLVPMVIKRDWQLMYFSILIGIYFAVFLSYFVTLQEVSRCYVFFMVLVSVWSVLCTYVIRGVVDAGILSVPVVYNTKDFRFFNFILAIVPETYVKYRNFGVFREPGVYQFFILIALYLNNYTLSWDKDWKLWAVNAILAVTMLTTFATGGVIELALFALVLFIDKKLYKKKIAWVIVLIGVAAAGIVIAYLAMTGSDLYNILYYMLVGKFQPGEDSSSDRFAAIGMGLEFFLRHPLVGEKLATVLHSTANNTSSSLILYAGLGVLGGTFHAATWVAFVWKKERKVWVNLALLVILFMSFNTQNLTWNIFFWLFPTMALAEKGLPLLKARKKG